MSFDRIAHRYQTLEALVFGGALQRARVAWLHKLERPQRILIVGEGNGRFLTALLDAYPQAQIDCVDASARMLQLAHDRLMRKHPEAEAQVRFFCEDILHWLPDDRRYDVIVTHFVLDCFRAEELRWLVARLSEIAEPGAVWLLADFHISQGPLARAHAHVWVMAMYLFFRLTTRIKATRLVNPTAFLKRTGFSRLHRRHWWGGLIKSELWQRLA